MFLHTYLKNPRLLRSAIFAMLGMVLVTTTNAQRSSEYVEGKWDIGILAGASSTTISFESSINNTILTNSTFDPSVDFAGGVSFDFLFASDKRTRWSMANELLFTNYTLNGTYRVDTGTGTEAESIFARTQLGSSNIAMYNSLRLRFPVVREVLLFFNAGISIGLSVSQKNTQIVEVDNFFGQGVEEGEALERIRKTERALTFGGGVM